MNLTNINTLLNILKTIQPIAGLFYSKTGVLATGKWAWFRVLVNLKCLTLLTVSSGVGYWWIARTLLSPLVQKSTNIPCMTSQWRHKLRMSKTLKIAQIVVFRYFFKQKLHFLAMMCVKECLHTFVLQINQINKIKHTGRLVHKKTKTRLMRNFNRKSSFSLTQLTITRRSVITLHPILTQMVLNRAQGSKKKKVKKFHREKMSTGGDVTKNVWGLEDSAPGTFRVNINFE